MLVLGLRGGETSLLLSILKTLETQPAAWQQPHTSKAAVARGGTVSLFLKKSIKFAFFLKLDLFIFTFGVSFAPVYACA